MTTRDVRREAWSRYWSTGASHSCAESFDLNGAGGLAKFWDDVFSEASSPASIVDMATGNGGLLQIADDAALRDAKSWVLVGIDMAKPAPAWFDPVRDGNRVNFMGGVAMESTGLPSGEQDLLVSQFGIEYGERMQTQAECIRLLKANGRFAFVIHHHDSAITRAARDEIQAQSFLLDKAGLIAETLALLPHLARVRAGSRPNAAAHAARDAFNLAIERGSQLAGQLASPDLLQQAAAGTQQFLAAVSMDNVDDLQRQLRSFGNEVALARTRTEEQLECAMDRTSLDAFLQPFRAAGYTTSTEELYESNHLVAWGVKGKAA